MASGNWPVKFCPLRSLQESALTDDRQIRSDATAWRERTHMLVILPMHLRSPSAAGTVPTSLSAASVDAELSLATKPVLTVELSEVKATVIKPPVDVTAAGTAVPENLFSSSALVDVPSYTLTKSYLSSKLNSLKRTVIGPLADTTHMQLRERP